MLVYQPYDRSEIADVPCDDSASLEEKLVGAKRAFLDRSSWLPVYKRIEILKRLARLVEREQEYFAQLIAREGGKPLFDAQVEVSRAINSIEVSVAGLEQHSGDVIPMGLTEASKDRIAFTTKEPIGVVVAISAFNHPLNLIVHQVIPALAVGCPVIVKPASTTPLTCLRLVELIYEAGLPEVLCQAVISQDVGLVETLATNPDVAFLSFVGSAKVGWHLRSKLAPGTRCALEHGGAAPVIVDRSADVRSIIAPLAKGGYYHAGQVCVSTQRIFVHDHLKAAFIEQFIDRVHALRVGNPSSLETEVGPLILPKEVDRVSRWVQQATTLGAEVVTGGTRIGETMYQPTILYEPAVDALVSQEEVFGPVTCVYGFTDLRDAIERANSLSLSFQSAIFTQDIRNAFIAAKALDASTVMINDHTAFRTDWMPFAGRRHSGYGVGGIQYTMRDMTSEKMIVLNNSEELHAGR